MYTDDMHYLSDSRELILNDKSRVRSNELIHGAFSRLLLVQLISTIEFLLEEWGSKSENVNFEFMKSGHNLNKIQPLIDELEKSGREIDHDVVKDFIAGKILRNSIVHSNLGEDNKQFCIDRDLPETVTLLGEPHWSRFYNVYTQMTMYIWQSIKDFDEWPLRS